ncbi:MAG: cytoplasmic protein [Desulfobacterales bacterium]|nr:cytoplasmic protein [Desulfobacterales bacterium]
MKGAPYQFVPTNRQHPSQAQEDFKELEASELYCPNCARPVPVRKFLLLVLPDGDKYEYRCQLCGTKVGQKTDNSGQFYGILKK